MPEWGGNEGYNEEQKKVFLDFNNFLETLQPKKNDGIYFYVSCSQASIARHYGKMDMNGKLYKYIYTLDCLISENFLAKYRKFKKKEMKENKIEIPRINETEFLI